MWAVPTGGERQEFGQLWENRFTQAQLRAQVNPQIQQNVTNSKV